MTGGGLKGTLHFDGDAPIDGWGQAACDGLTVVVPIDGRGPSQSYHWPHLQGLVVRLRSFPTLLTQSKAYVLYKMRGDFVH